MKKFTTFILSAFIAIAFCSSCNKDNDYTPPSAVVTSLNSSFPNATDIYWLNYDFYQVAVFNQSNGNKTTAYFNFKGLLLLAGTSITESQIPDSVSNAFNSSLYSSWSIDALASLERINMPTLYVYTVSSSSNTFMLYYNEQGEVVMQLNGGPAVNSPSNTPYEMVLFIRSAYYGAMIVDTRYLIGGNIEVEILHINSVKNVVFNSSLNWAFTYWQLPTSAVPTNILDVIEDSIYADYTIEEVIYIQNNNDSDLYQFTLSKEGMTTVELEINTLGQVIED